MSFCRLKPQGTNTNNKNISASGNQNFDFEKSTVGQLPTDWDVALTGDGKMCDWKVLNAQGNKLVAQTSNIDKSYRFNLLVNQKLSYKDVEISLRFKAVKGHEDQGGGMLWRYIDENNYYVVRANPLENNYRLYKLVDGRRIELASTNIEMSNNVWYSLKIRMIDNKIQCYFNGKLKMEQTDDTFSNIGKIGLWTKSDAQTYFDDVAITNLE